MPQFPSLKNKRIAGCGNPAFTQLIQPWLTRRSVFSLTKDVHTRLPRELRDMVYQYLITPRDISEIEICAAFRLDRFPYRRGEEPQEYKTFPASKTDLPFIADAKIVYKPFAHEIVGTVYESHRDLWVDMPSAIPKFLDTDFFGTGCTPRHARLPKLHISGLLDVEKRLPNVVNLATLQADLATLLECTWGRGFELDIVFRTELGISHSGERYILTLAHTMCTVWQTLMPFLTKAEKRGARVQVLMLTMTKTYRYTSEGHDMLGTEEEWLDDLRVALRGLYEGQWRMEYIRQQPRKSRKEDDAVCSLEVCCWTCKCCRYTSPKNWCS
jgi:hypothetical protein